MMKKYSKFWLSLILLLVSFVVFVGPWPGADDDYRTSSYAATTFARVENMTPSLKVSPLYAGWGEAEISPPIGVALGGYSARNPKANTGTREPLFAKALTIRNSDRDVTFLSADFLLPLPELIEAVIAKTGLHREQIYFAATHTHSGPGAYTQHLVQQFALGDFDAAYFALLVKQLSQAVTDSRSTSHAVTLQYSALRASEDQIPRLLLHQLGNNKDAYAVFHRLAILDAQNGTNLYNMVSFSAHPTIWGRINHLASGDYPSRLQQDLAAAWHSKVMFVIGAPGGLIPPPTDIPQDTVAGQEAFLAEYSQRLTHWILQSTPTSDTASLLSFTSYRDISIDNNIVPIELPVSNYRILGEWRLSPLLVNSLFHDRMTYIHQVRLGNIFFFGYPADFAAEIAKKLDSDAKPKGYVYWPTSFNGDYIGYLSSSDLFARDLYVTHDVNFFGPWAGDYLADISRQIAAKQTYGGVTK